VSLFVGNNGGSNISSASRRCEGSSSCAGDLSGCFIMSAGNYLQQQQFCEKRNIEHLFDQRENEVGALCVTKE
jgi:hypothetical protein